MKVKIFFSLLVACLIGFIHVAGQTPPRPGHLDSLRSALRLAKNDTVKLKLKFEICELTGEGSRIGHWDSLAKEAHLHHMSLLECQALGNLAYLSNVDNNFSDAIKYIRQAIQIAAEHHHNALLLALRADLGFYYLNTSQLRKALETCFDGLKLAEDLKDQKAILTFNTVISTAYWTLGDYNKLLTRRFEALKIYTQQKDSFNICTTLISIGNAYSALHNLPKAGEYYFKSAKFFKPYYDSRSLGKFYSAMGAAYQIKKQPDSAAVYLDKFYKLSETRKSKTEMASALALIAENEYMMGKNAEAKKQALKALQLSREINFKVQIPNLALTLKKIFVKEKNYKEALEAYELSVSTRDTLSSEKNRRLANEQEFNYEFEKKENENKLLAQQNQIQALQLRQTNYFLAGMGAVLILVFIIGFLFVRQNRIKSQQATTQLEQKLLRSQMNPHFIFNSLQAIQNFILKHDEKEAARYLSSFAAVTRNVLENSRMEAIPLKKEITLLENYLQLQKLRFKNRFDYEIDVDSEIDMDAVSIPPMFSQPFIENAVEHGFHGVESGKIRVSYALKDNQLLMEISDNGIGMKDAHTPGKQHRSLALEITKERVALMNKKARERILFAIGEAFPLLQERKGVKVNFSFPLKFQ